MRFQRNDVILLGAIAVFVVSQINIIMVLGPLASDLVPLQLNFSSTELAAQMGGWNADERQSYATHLAFDMVHPLIYGFALCWAVLRVNQLMPLEPLMLRLAYTAAVGAPALDYIENALHYWFMHDAAAIAQPAVFIAATAAWLKWLCVAGLLAFLIWRLPRAYRLSR